MEINDNRQHILPFSLFSDEKKLCMLKNLYAQEDWRAENMFFGSYAYFCSGKESASVCASPLRQSAAAFRLGSGGVFRKGGPALRIR